MTPVILRKMGFRVNLGSFVAHSNELMQWRGVRSSVCLSVNFAQIADSTRQMVGSPPNLHKMVPGRAYIQGVLKLKVEVKGHVIPARLEFHKDESQSHLRWHENRDQNQTVNDGVAHSKNPRKCAYHVTFDLDLEHTLDARLPGDHRVQVWWRSGHLSARRSDLRKSLQTDRRTTDAAPLH